MAEASYLNEEGSRSSAHPARELAVAELFAHQKTIATLEQLCRLGLSRRAVQNRAQLQRLYRIYPAVYTTTPPPLLPAKARWLAAVLACGPDALLSHRTAAALHGIRPTAASRVDVTSRTARGRRLTGIDAHQAANLTPADIAEVDGIPCTSLPRTFIDFAPLVPLRAVERGIDQAEMLEIFDLHAFNEVLARNPTLPGAAIVRALLEEYQRAEAHFSTLTENDFEEAFLALCDEAAFPRPEVQQYLTLPGGFVFRADFLWRELRVVVETDGDLFHRTRRAREEDARRDLLLAQNGWQTLRVTWRMVFITPLETKQTLGGVLARAQAARARHYSPHG